MRDVLSPIPENIGISEVERQDRAERAAKAKADREREQAAAVVEKPAPENKIADQQPEDARPIAPEPKPQPAPSSKLSVSVVCEFDIEVPASTPFATIEAAYRKRIEDAGFKTLSRVSITKN